MVRCAHARGARRAARLRDKCVGPDRSPRCSRMRSSARSRCATARRRTPISRRSISRRCTSRSAPSRRRTAQRSRRVAPAALRAAACCLLYVACRRQPVASRSALWPAWRISVVRRSAVMRSAARLRDGAGGQAALHLQLLRSRRNARRAWCARCSMRRCDSATPNVQDANIVSATMQPLAVSTCLRLHSPLPTG